MTTKHTPQYAAAIDALRTLTLRELNELRIQHFRELLEEVAGREAEERERVVGSNGEVRDE